MKVEMSYHAQIRMAAHGAAETADLPAGANVTALLAALCARHGEEFRRLVCDAAGHARPGIILLVNDRLLEPGADPALADGDRVALLSPMAGG